MAIIVETPRLVLRELTPDDLDALAAIYADPVTMRTMLGPKDRATTREQLDRIIGRYAEWRYGLYATELRDGTLIGRCGLLRWEIDGVAEIEVGYLLHHPYWRQGYATEAARALRDHAFHRFTPARVISLIWTENPASQAVAQRNDMINTHARFHIVDGMDHEIWEITADRWRARSR